MRAELLEEAERITHGNKLGRPPLSRDRYGRYQRAGGAEWDWFYSLPPAERTYIQREWMTDHGVTPDVVATWHNVSTDEAMGQWVMALRSARTRSISTGEILSDDWDMEEPEPDDGIPELVGTRGLADLFGVAPSTPRVWRARGKLPDPDYLVDGEHAVWTRATISAWIDQIILAAG